jgi:Uma2 family endonuclease
MSGSKTIPPIVRRTSDDRLSKGCAPRRKYADGSSQAPFLLQRRCLRGPGLKGAGGEARVGAYLTPFRAQGIIEVRFPQELAMGTVLPDLPPTAWTPSDVQSWLPGFPADRILMEPTPGTATEEDLLAAESRTGRICELIDGTLVGKVMASLESMVAVELAYFIRRYLETNDIGIVLGGDGFLKILPQQVRAPDVSFICWERFAEHKLPRAAIFAVSPDLAAEILSESNTKAEMNRKLRDYFRSGTRLVWYIDPHSRTARAYTAVRKWADIGPDDSLLGGDVLPRFELPLAQLFARVDR